MAFIKTLVKVIICVVGGFYAAGCIGTCASCVMRYMRLTRSPTLSVQEIRSLGKPLDGALTSGVVGAFILMALVAMIVCW